LTPARGGTRYLGEFVAVTPYTINSVRGLISSKTEIVDGVETKTYFTYDPNNKHGNVVKTTSTNSRGQTVETETIYPSDPGSGAPRQMFDKNNSRYKNMLGVVIDQKTSVDGKQVSRSHNYFTYYVTDDLLLLTRKRTYATTGAEHRDMRLFYDESNRVQSVERQNDLTTSFLWGYNNSLPIAKVDNVRLVQTEESIETSKSFGASTNSSVTTATFINDFTLDTDQTVSVTYDYSCSFSSCSNDPLYSYANVHIRNDQGEEIADSNVRMNQSGEVNKEHTLPAGTYGFYYTATLSRPPWLQPKCLSQAGHSNLC
jgi:hypothetical protein